MARRFELSLGITVKDIEPSEFAPLLEMLREFVGAGKLTVDPETRRILERHPEAKAAFPVPATTVLEADKRRLHAPPASVVPDSQELFGKWVRRIRGELDMTQKELAALAGTSSGHISRIEWGKSRNVGAPLCARIVRVLERPRG